jgi:hypothetical protein
VLLIDVDVEAIAKCVFMFQQSARAVVVEGEEINKYRCKSVTRLSAKRAGARV